MVSTERRSNWHHSLRTGDTMLEASKEQEAEWTPPAPFLIQWYKSCGRGGGWAGAEGRRLLPERVGGRGGSVRRSEPGSVD